MAFGARLFNGIADQIDCGGGVAAPTPAITISAWVYPTSLSNALSAIYCRFNAISTLYHVIYIRSSGHFGYYLFANANVSLDPGIGAISTGSWHHTAFRYDSTNGLAAFLDGTSDGTAAANGSVATGFAGTDHTGIGFDTFTAGRNFGGRIADTALWNAALTNGEIAALAQGARPFNIRQASLLHYCPLDGIQSPEPDFSGFGNNGTLTGTTNVAGPPITLFTPRRPLFPTPLQPPVTFTLMGQAML